MMPETSKTILKACSINKSFPGVQALSAVDFELMAGEVHALVGENGAGKSTLTRIIAGVETADSGRMELYGQRYDPNGRSDVEAHGIRMVMQELHLISNLSVAENIFIEKLPSKFGFIDYNKLNCNATEIMKQVGLENIDPNVSVRLLGVGQQQMVEIAAGLSRQCRILALDEPTASLTDREIELLFVQINKLKAEGVGIIYISHRIEEVTRISDRVTVLRDGKVISTNPTSELCVDDIIRKMVGCDLAHEELRRDSNAGQVVLRVVGLNRGQKVKDVSFEVRRGEVLGVAGLMGAGRTETMRAVFGADLPDSGEIYLYGASEPTEIRTPRDAVRSGIAFLTEDRKEQGLLSELAVRVNISLTRLNGVSRLGWMDLAEERSVADRYIAALGVRCSSNEQTVGQLSGGNQQKVVIAKWMYRDCDILIFDEPTRGIDVGAKFEIYRMLEELAEKGKAIILVSSDNKELMAVCNRIMVMSAGLVAATFGPRQWNQEKIMSAAFSQYVGV
ncbi:MAG: sugar ABC transporter ATP-binding protein [Planctomycetes bacterium]|nr:sugar ABC transporter ATP-binding protein [Planctomycetota bacterium]